MFDDQPIQQNGIPNNLPIDDNDPKDMFADVDPVPEAAATPQTETSPPIQEEKTAMQPSSESNGGIEPLPTAVNAGKLKPKANADMSEQSLPAQSNSAAEHISTMPPEFQSGKFGEPAAAMPVQDQTMQGSNIGKTIMLIVLIIVIALVIGGGLWFAFTTFFVNSDETVTDGPPAVVELPVENNENVIENEIPNTDGNDEEAEVPVVSVTSTEDTTETDINTAVDNEILFGEAIDTDEDQLDDEREKEFGTDPRNWDTDGDGLGDGVEVLNWGTDPLNPDTDGDGFEDGAEVNSGYSPIAAGGAKLFETTSTTSN